MFLFLSLQKESLSDVQLHNVAREGDLYLLRRILDSGKVHVDCKDKVELLSAFNMKSNCSTNI